jgi:phage tail-like protein
MAEATERNLLQYLPAIFHKLPTEPTTEIPLRDYLAPFEKVFQEFDQLLATLDNYVAPQLTPSEEFLPWLASWVALVFDTDWTESQKRRIIEEAVELYRWRGTVYGLKRYLQLYVDIPMEMVEIQEAAWPAGMQIGVSSRIGKAEPITDAVPETGEVERTQHDAYVVDTRTPSAQPSQVYYQSEQVVKIELAAEGVHLWYRPKSTGNGKQVARNEPEAAGVRPKAEENPEAEENPVVYNFHARRENGHDSPNIAFHGARVDYHYRRLAGQALPQPAAVDYYGGAFLIDQISLPYRFIVHLQLPADELEQMEDPKRDAKLARIRRILDLEKPAHTEYYLKLSPAVDRVPLRWMQIEVRSSIGLDTLVA